MVSMTLEVQFRQWRTRSRDTRIGIEIAELAASLMGPGLVDALSPWCPFHHYGDEVAGTDRLEDQVIQRIISVAVGKVGVRAEGQDRNVQVWPSQ